MEAIVLGALYVFMVNVALYERNVYERLLSC